MTYLPEMHEVIFLNQCEILLTMSKKVINCCDLSDHVPPRSYALFQARFALQELGETLRAERRGEVT